VAIDGPGASGKSTVAAALARSLGFLYVNTGAMYRTLAWHCLQSGIDPGSPRAVAAACRRWKTRLHLQPGDPPEIVLLVEGYRPTAELRTRAVTRAASDIAIVPAVRQWMKRTQRDCAEFGDLVMEGRDIGSNVFPGTQHKFWLDALADERARRRRAQGMEDDLALRDRQDSQRAAAPLMLGLGAVHIDTTGRSPGEVVDQILARIRPLVEQGSDESPGKPVGGTTGPE
jgi:cytidylate kinase